MEKDLFKSSDINCWIQGGSAEEARKQMEYLHEMNSITETRRFVRKMLLALLVGTSVVTLLLLLFL